VTIPRRSEGHCVTISRRSGESELATHLSCFESSFISQIILLWATVVLIQGVFTNGAQ